MNHRILVFLIAVIWLCGCSETTVTDSPSITELKGKALGTTWSVKILATSDFSLDDLRTDIVEKLEETDKIFSHWRPDSELYQFNAAITTTPISINPQLLSLLKHSKWIHQQSGGAFDPSIAPIVNLWGFGPVGKTRSTIPTNKQIGEALSLTGMNKIELLQKGLVRKKLPTLQLDFSGSAKGEIIDQICTLLQGWNFNNFLVEIGGEVRAHGKGRNGKGWVVGLENGGTGKDSLKPVNLRNYSVATSGTYQLNKPYPDSNQSASHLMDPRTGRPVDHDLIAVNAFAPSARDADAWATALMILGPKEGMEKAEELDMVARFCSTENGRMKISFSTAYQRLYLSDIP
ncbi:MAG: FAD:protein FMN transferase [Opitutae bacterium]|nr:FAD:protein FMN transferase [Opitutae bacterium]